MLFNNKIITESVSTNIEDRLSDYTGVLDELCFTYDSICLNVNTSIMLQHALTT